MSEVARTLKPVIQRNPNNPAQRSCFFSEDELQIQDQMKMAAHANIMEVVEV